jgi:hypothetical protein
MKITHVSLLFLACIFTATCADQSRTTPVQDARLQNTATTPTTQSAEVPRKYDTASIVADLTAKAKQFDSFAVDYIVGGQVAKRMSFLFKKNGEDFYSYRSDYFQDGKKYSRLFGVDGKYDYEYSPSDKAAVRRPTQMKWNESNYSSAKDWHFDFDGYEVVGEKQLNGKECYVLESKENIITVWKENGMWTSLTSKAGGKQPLIYDNFAFNLSEEEFSIPEGTDIRE